ncbi:MAG: peptide ABC transporter substrate-binding protein [Oscillospiraceae bacterium]|nr:peptide ABC transporter substrate-binding protein [Oscillospiraceae bacterium]
MKRSLSVLLVLLLLLSLSLPTAFAAPEQKIKIVYETEPISMDPHVGNDSTTSTALGFAFQGLLDVVNGAVTPGMAESYDVSEDGTVYTFHLRDAMWSDGKPVTAGDFADTWVRMLTREDAMDLAYLIFPIKNAAAVNEKTLDPSELGVKVIDEKTLEVTLEGAYPFMVTLFASSPMYPIRLDLVEQYGDAYGSAPDKMACNGAFLFKEWAHSDRMVFVKNPDFWDAGNIKLEEISMLYVLDGNTRKNMYDVGDVDFLDLAPTPDMVPVYQDTPEFQFLNAGGVQFIALSHKGINEEHAKITSNRNFQMALSAAIDREAFVAALFPMHTPSTTVVNPVISDQLGGKWGDHAEYDLREKYHKTKADPEAAKAYLDKALEELGYASVDALPSMDFFTTDAEIQRTISEYLQDVWLTTLGVEIEVRQLAFAQYWENLYNQPYDIVRTGWGPDYDDPFTYLDMWDSRGGWNKTGWEGKEYYELVTEANAQSDMKTRNDMLSRAEEILLTEAPILPLYMARTPLLLRGGKLANVGINVFGARFDVRYAELME